MKVSSSSLGGGDSSSSSTENVNVPPFSVTSFLTAALLVLSVRGEGERFLRVVLATADSSSEDEAYGSSLGARAMGIGASDCKTSSSVSMASLKGSRPPSKAAVLTFVPAERRGGEGRTG